MPAAGDDAQAAGEGLTPMRSMLFIPGDDEKKLGKGVGSGADALILDLEDSVSGPRKAAARSITGAYIAATRALERRPLIYVRINALDTGLWEADLAGVMPSRPDGILLPKAKSGEDVHKLSIALHHAEERVSPSPRAATASQLAQSEGQPPASAQGSAPHPDPLPASVERTRIIALVTEVPISILAMHTYVGASARLVGLSWGAEDLAAAIGASANRRPDGSWTSPYELARSLCLFTAVAAEAEPIDTVFINFRDEQGFRAEASAAARDGFTGKLAIHPAQVPVINEIFTPSAAEVALAQEIVKVFADNPDAGVLAIEGKMYDRAHIKGAERILARAQSVAQG
jgi:citrate lyase subunit beta/citryl-CoA lyase